MNQKTIIWDFALLVGETYSLLVENDVQIRLSGEQKPADIQKFFRLLSIRS
jgi:hypothetical protein